MDYKRSAWIAVVVLLALGAALSEPERMLAFVGGAIVRVSVSSDGTPANAASFAEDMSPDGRYVVFSSEAANLVPGDSNTVRDLFVHDRQTGATARVSLTSGGGQANGPSYAGRISADGRYVAFYSDASNLVTGDSNGDADVFVRDRQSGTTVRVSVSSAGAQGNEDSIVSAISAEGRYVLLWSGADNLVIGDTNETYDVFLHDRLTAATTRVSVASGGAQANNASYGGAISADGTVIAFESTATNLSGGDANGGLTDVFVHHPQTGTTTLVSLSSDETQGDGQSEWPRLSADGRFVAFMSLSTNLVPGGTAPDYNHVYVRNLQLGTTTLESVTPAGLEGDAQSWTNDLSADGRYLVFTSWATDLVAGDTNEWPDVFVRDRASGATQRVSVSATGQQGSGDSRFGEISSDGAYVAFTSDAPDLIGGDTNGVADAFVKALSPGAPTALTVGTVGVQRPAAAPWWIVLFGLALVGTFARRG